LLSGGLGISDQVLELRDAQLYCSLRYQTDGWYMTAAAAVMTAWVSVVRRRWAEPISPGEQRLSPLDRTLGVTGEGSCFIINRGAFLRGLHQPL